MSRGSCRLLLALLLVASLGCGESGPPKPKLYPVSGKVTVNGTPLKDCAIQFSPTATDGTSYSGTLGSDGSFTLSDPQDQRVGAAAGKYKIVLSLSGDAKNKATMTGMTQGQGQGPPNLAANAPFPSEYGTASTSPKVVEVKAESNTIEITIP